MTGNVPCYYNQVIAFCFLKLKYFGKMLPPIGETFSYVLEMMITKGTFKLNLTENLDTYAYNIKNHK